MPVNQDQYTRDIRNIANDFQSSIGRCGLLPSEYLKNVESSLNNNVFALLDSPKPKVMVYGIYNSGKSTLVNALCRQAVAEVADRPMTWRVDEYDAGRYILIDSPGINAPIEHEELADRHLKDCHLILFVISSQGIFEDRVNYEKMWSLIQKRIPFYIILNERAVALPDDPQKREIVRLEHQRNLNNIKNKIIENLMKVSGNRNIGEKYDVIIIVIGKLLIYFGVISSFSPTSHGACDFHRTPRSIVSKVFSSIVISPRLCPGAVRFSA